VTLPQLSGSLFVADGGMETTLIFRVGFDLPHFAAFTLLDDGRGRAGLRAYYEPYPAVARDHACGGCRLRARRAVVHGGDRRPAAERSAAARGGGAGRCRDGREVSYFMVNCAHPTHFDGVLAGDEPWVKRVRGLRPNASTKSHAELDEAEELDEGDPADLGARLGALRRRLPDLTVGGEAHRQDVQGTARRRRPLSRKLGPGLTCGAPPARRPRRRRSSLVVVDDLDVVPIRV
jgi:hypothetical protein